MKKYPASVLNMVQMITAFVLSAVSLVLFGETDFQVTTQGWLSVLYLGVISTTVCYLLQTACQKYVDETKAADCTFNGICIWNDFFYHHSA